jgi:transposase-like protein
VARQAHVVTAWPERNRARFACHTCGHEWNGEMMRRLPNGEYPSVELIQRFARYWGQRVTVYCPRCSRVS